jgi:hypothetical protein
MKPSAEPPDPAEPDLYWAGHSGWAMVPGFVLGVIASAAVMLSAPPIGRWVDMPPDWTAFLRFWLVFLGWVAAGIVWAYRGASFVYRLTPLRLYMDFGMLYRPVPPIALVEIDDVECRAWRLGRTFAIGSVIVNAKDRAPIRLRGIFNPRRFADAIRAAVRSARGE